MFITETEIDCGGEGEIINCRSVNKIKFVYDPEAIIVMCKNFNQTTDGISPKCTSVVYGFYSIDSKQLILSSNFATIDFILADSKMVHIVCIILNDNATNEKINCYCYPVVNKNDNGLSIAGKIDIALGYINSVSGSDFIRFQKLQTYLLLSQNKLFTYSKADGSHDEYNTYCIRQNNVSIDNSINNDIEFNLSSFVFRLDNVKFRSDYLPSITPSY